MNSSIVRLASLLTCIGGAFLAAPGTASALVNEDWSATGGTQTIWIGTVAGKAQICYGGTLYPLATGSSLTDDVRVQLGSGTSYVSFVRNGAFEPDIFTGCGYGAASWSDLVFNSHYVRVDTWGSRDYINGPAGSPDVRIYGENGDDWIWTYSTTGSFYGGAGIDEFAGTYTSGGSAEIYFGEADNDYVCDADGSYSSSSDCGTGTNYSDVSSPPTNCTYSTSICCACF